MSGQTQRGEENAQVVRLAEFRILGPGPQGDPVPVHFNPESLEYSLTNNIKEQGNSTENKQQVSKSSGKLSMELLFDSTLDGTDVREQTEKFQNMMKPVPEGGKKVAPVVEFAWGTYRFRGIFTSYKETIDYFSATGVPLRATLSVSMTQQDGLFDPTAKGEAELDESEAFEPPANEDSGEAGGPVTGDPAADRGLAEDNGEENPRFFSGKSLNLPSGPNLQPAAAFASGGLSLGVSGGLGLGVDVGFSAGVSAGIGIGLGIEGGLDVGLSASFDFDIGVDVAIEAKVSASASGMGGSSSTVGGGGAAATGAPAAFSSVNTGALEAGGAVGGTAFGGGPGPEAGESDGFDVFDNTEFTRGSSQAGSPSPSGRPRLPVFGDALDDLPRGPSFGGAAAAGVSAALGAFDGLRRVPPRRRKPISLAELQGARPERGLRTDAGADFEIGGRAINRASRGLSADVGAQASLFDRVTFDDTLD